MSDGRDSLITSFAAHLQSSDVRPNTIRAYMHDVRAFIEWADRRALPLSDITTPDLIAYRASMMADSLKPSSINRHMIALRRLFSYLVDTQIVIDNPAAPLKRQAQIQPPPRHLTDLEIRDLLAAVRRYGKSTAGRDSSIIVFLLHTGLRRDELLSLVTDDLTIRERSGSVLIRSGKGGKRRTVPLNATARSAAQSILGDSARQYFLIGRDGGHLSAAALNKMLGHYSYLAQIDRISPHDLRHAFAYRMAKVIPLHELARLLGHDDPKTTMIYTQPTAQDLQAAVDQIAWQ
jgi:integrase/recombinase XerC